MIESTHKVDASDRAGLQVPRQGTKRQTKGSSHGTTVPRLTRSRMKTLHRQVQQSLNNEEDVVTHSHIQVEDGSFTRRQVELLENKTVSDVANTECLKALFGDKLAYNPEYGYLHYNSRFWEVDAEKQHIEAIVKTVRLRKQFVMANISDRSDERRFESFFQRAEDYPRIRGMLELSKSMLKIDSNIFDSDKTLLNVGNGAIDMQTAALRPHRREDFCMKISPVPFTPEAPSTLWAKTLNEITGGNLELQMFLQRAAGYSATGSTMEQVLLFMLGEGGNGKSLLMDVLGAALGGYGGPSSYALKADTETLLGMRERGGGSASPDLMALKNSRLVFCSETSAGMRINDARLKDLTGGDPITARGLYEKKLTTFSPQGTIWISGNNRPIVRDLQHGFWRRLRLIEFNQRFKPSRRKDELMKPENLASVLSWTVEGAKGWFSNGLITPDFVDSATRSYAQESDLVSMWIDSDCERVAHFTEPSSNLFGSFSSWMNRNGERPMSQTALGRRLGELGFTKTKTDGGRAAWMGLRVVGKVRN